MNIIRELRKKKDISQKVLAIELAVSQPTVCDWEKGIKAPGSENLKKLADYFDVSIDYLLGRNDSDDMQIKKPTVENDSELRKRIIDRVKQLPDPALEHTWAYLEGLRVGQEIAPAKPAVRGSDPVQPE